MQRSLIFFWRVWWHRSKSSIMALNLLHYKLWSLLSCYDFYWRNPLKKSSPTSIVLKCYLKHLFWNSFEIFLSRYLFILVCFPNIWILYFHKEPFLKKKLNSSLIREKDMPSLLSILYITCHFDSYLICGHNFKLVVLPYILISRMLFYLHDLTYSHKLAKLCNSSPVFSSLSTDL